MRRSVEGSVCRGAGARTAALVAAFPAVRGVPHSLQNRPVPTVPHDGQGCASDAPHDEQNFAVSALTA
jgi:hypothetical protein